MDSNIAARYYFEDNVLELEKHLVFRKNWYYVGLKNDLKNHNDFITHNIGGVPVLIQNLKGEVKAFLNVCSHRFSILQKEPMGNRALVCPYHGWSYDKNGIPTGIPKKPLFKDFSADELCQLKLQEYSIDVCGDFYFVCIDTPEQSLKDYLGDFYSEMEKISSSIGEACDINRMVINVNWKVIVENTLESYHVNLIHTNTFRKLGASGLIFNFTNSHSNWVAELATPEDSPQLAKVHKPFEDRHYKINGYIHFLIFPNLLVSSSYGTSFNLSLVSPVSASTTEFVSYVYLAKTNGQGGAMLSFYKESLIDFNRTVFKEDKDICEEVQKGVSHTMQNGVLSLEEKRVHFFQEEYIKKIS